MTPTDCPKWERCSAPICPLDPDVLKRSYLRDEPVCFFLREHCKPDSCSKFARIGTFGRGHNKITGKLLYELINDLIPSLCALFPALKRPLNRASKTGSRLNRKVGEPLTSTITDYSSVNSNPSHGESHG